LGIKRKEKFENARKKISNIEKYTTLELMDSLISDTDYLSKYKIESEENLARLENIKELRSVAQEFSNLTEFLENVALVEAQQSEKGVISKQKESLGKITLMTTHAAKGLEFEVVFMVGMEEGLFPIQEVFLI